MKKLLKFVFIIIIAIVIFAVIFGGNSKKEKATETTTTVATKTVTEALTEEPTSTPEITEEPKATIKYLLDGENECDIGIIKTLNKGTEFERIYMQYFLPSGIYKVTHIDSNVKSVQISPYINDVNIVDGWEEFATPKEKPIVLFLDDTKELKIEDDVFVAFSNKCDCTFEKIN